MATKEAIDGILSIFAALLIFLGTQAYFGSYITQYPWAAILVGMGIFIWKRKWVNNTI